MYVYQSSYNNAILFSSYHNNENDETVEEKLSDITFLLERVKNDFNQAKLIIANNDCIETTINGVYYIINDEPIDTYTMEYKTIELTVFPDKMEAGCWLGMNDGFMVYASLNITTVGTQIILYENH